MVNYLRRVFGDAAGVGCGGPVLAGGCRGVGGMGATTVLVGRVRARMQPGRVS